MSDPTARIRAAARRLWHHTIDKATASSRAADQRLMEWPAILRAAMSDRGMCQHCGHEHALRPKDGRVREHHGCPGGNEFPAPTLIGGEQ